MRTFLNIGAILGGPHNFKGLLEGSDLLQVGVDLRLGSGVRGSSSGLGFEDGAGVRTVCGCILANSQ